MDKYIKLDSVVEIIQKIPCWVYEEDKDDEDVLKLSHRLEKVVHHALEHVNKLPQIDFGVDLNKQPNFYVSKSAENHWVYDHWCEFKCSNCGAWSKSEPYRGKEKYCPNCGSKMTGIKA